MTDETIIAYLLDELAEEEHNAFEEECFAAAEWPAQISLVETDLIDDYLRDRLPPLQHTRFETHYAVTPARQRRIICAAALLRHVDNPQPIKPPTRFGLGWFFGSWRDFWRTPRLAWRIVPVMLSLAAVLSLAGWLYYDKELRPPATFTLLTLTLNAGQRGAGSTRGPKGEIKEEILPVPEIKLPLPTDALKLTLVLPPDAVPATRYVATLERSDSLGSTLLAASVREAGRVEVDIRANHLTRGDYVLYLSAIAADGTKTPVVGAGRYHFKTRD